MLILAFDTATDRLTVALGRNKEILSEANIIAPREHMERLLPTIDNLLGQCKVKPDDLDAIIVGLGPGSFTGVRIGVSTARGLAQGLGKRIVGIATSDCLAFGLEWDGKIACVVDAKREEVYVSFHLSTDKETKRLTGNKIFTLQDFCRMMEQHEEDKVLMAGDALFSYGDLFKSRLGSKIQFASLDDWYPKAGNLIKLFFNESVQKTNDLLEVKPIYIRLSQAEEVWKKRQTERTEKVVMDNMTAEDIEEILKIEKSLFSSPWNQWIFKAEMKKKRSSCLVARIEGVMVGYAILNYLEKEGHLMNLAVVPEYQKRGIGSVLLTRLMKVAKQNGVRRIILEVRPSNLSARRFYRKFGFQEIGVRKEYYAEGGENGLVLWTGDISLQRFKERLYVIEKEMEAKFDVIDHTLVQ